MSVLPAEENRRLINEAVQHGYLSPRQANLALKEIKRQEPVEVDLLKMLPAQQILSARRWQEFLDFLKSRAEAEAKVEAERAAQLLLAQQKKKELPQVLGGFRIVEKIGGGGMGTVYKAEQLRMGRHVALKVLSSELSADPIFVERFMREARAAAALNHPNVIVPIGIEQDQGYHFIAMEYIDGESLSNWIDREGRLAWKDAVQVVLQVARGLQHAHKLGLVHRDIKPDNLLFDRASQLIKIVDMGLAKRFGEKSKATRSGSPVGTPYYISPEQARGEEQVDGRSDIYSLGATCWHLLVGVPPFEGPSSAVIMTKHITEPVPDPRTAVKDCPGDLVAIVQQMMAKVPQDRYASCEELIVDLERLLQGKPLKYTGQKKRKTEHFAVTGQLSFDQQRQRGANGTIRNPSMAGSRVRSLHGSRRDPSHSRFARDPKRSRFGVTFNTKRAQGIAPSLIYAVSACLIVIAATLAYWRTQADKSSTRNTLENVAPNATQPAEYRAKKKQNTSHPSGESKLSNSAEITERKSN